jgi:hypothetical protein
MTKPANVINFKTIQADEIITKDGQPVNFSNSAGVELMDGLFQLSGVYFYN